LKIVVVPFQCSMYKGEIKELRRNKTKMVDLNLIVGALPGGVSLSVGHSKWGVAWELGSSLGVGEGSAKVRQRMSALDRPGGMKFYG